jgi:hypothetical protein
MGNFAILGRRELIPEQEIAALQPLLQQINRGKIAGNREFVSA